MTRRLTDLSLLQMATLAVLADRGRTGAEALVEVRDRYEEEVPRRTFYDHVERLVERDLVEKRTPEGNDRGKEYVATAEGVRFARYVAAQTTVLLDSAELYSGTPETVRDSAQ